MRTKHRLSGFAAVLLGCGAIITGCENGQSQRSGGGGGATGGPSPAWIEQYHREQLRQEYERQQREEALRQRSHH